MSVNFNPYENYRIRVFENSGELRNYKKDVVVDNRRERVVLLIGQVAPDKFAIGYDIFFADGRRAGRLPSLEFGYFVREREAKLYFLGYIKQNRSRFLPSTIEAVDDLIRTIIQPGKRTNDYIQSGQGRREVFRRVGVSLHRPVLCFYAGLFFPHTPFVENVWESAAVQGIR